MNRRELLVQAFAPLASSARQQSEYDRGYPVDINRIAAAATPMEGSRTPITVRESAWQHLEARIRARHPRATRIVLQRAYTEDRLAHELDAAYADRLAQLGKQSIAHMQAFLADPQLPTVDVRFRLPLPGDAGRPSLSRWKADRAPTAEFYLMQRTHSTVWECLVEDGGRQVLAALRVDEPGNGGEFRRFFNFQKARQGWRFVSMESAPIIYNTLEQGVILAEAPALETLHKMVESYTLSHIRTRLRTYEQEYDQVVRRYTQREEQFVHALSMLWWEEFNKVAGFPRQRVEERFARYATHPAYAGLAQMHKSIQGLGAQGALQVYRANPDKLCAVQL